ncbi:L,D-transpeptidase [Flavobacterium sp.]|uniref:L,D-transpeptidase n=1 Tax=Flavobacterium sp. TaxID=239 RepID=UPI00262191E2|nr:L,D-transpeptidase [Flavobacterium sp.]
MKSKILLLTIISIVTLISCKQNRNSVNQTKEIVRKQPKVVSYTMENTKMWLKQNATDSSKIEIVTAINRTNRANLYKLDSLVIPSDFDGDVVYYLPFPLQVDYLKDVSKVLLFSYPTQTFGAYENGVLTYSGPTNMGRKKDKTPLGLFFTNWKAEQTTSTFDDEWELKWNFNIENKLGVGFHEYSLPGLPVSHSCLRLLEKDAKFLYEWADEWILADEENVKVKGTPVIVFGNYAYDEPEPWIQLIKNSKALDLSQAQIEDEISPFLKSILKQQKIREDYTEATTK